MDSEQIMLALLILLVCGIPLGIGIFVLANRDAYWNLQKWNNSMEGVQSEPTDAWEKNRIFSGVFMILLSIGAAIYLFTLFQ